MAKKPGMGRGLAALFPEAGSEGSGAGASALTISEDPTLRQIPLDKIAPNPDQPRKNFDAASISALAGSLSANGVIQPVLVRPLDGGTFELIAGERRWRAAREAGLEQIPALVSDPDQTARIQVALIENMAREDLNPLDAARACAALVEDLELTKEEVAQRVGKSRSAISNLIRLLDLPDEALELIASGDLSEGHGKAILQARDHDERRRLAREAARYGWSVRETERQAKGAATSGGRSSAKVTLHPDHAAALERGSEALERALGREVAVKPAGKGIKAELRFEDVEELLALAERLDAGA